MTERPHDTVATALLDAVATAPVLDTGGVDRVTVECAEAVESIADNLARERYRRDHPDADLEDAGRRFNATREGRRLLAIEGTAWLLDHGHLRIVEGGGLTLGKPFKIGSGKSKVAYVLGSGREEALFHDIRGTTPSRLDLLRESIAVFGDLREYFPVLEDEDGNVVDGRHRRAFDPEWKASPSRVPRDKRVATAVVANRSNAWTPNDWKRLRAHAQFVGGREATGRELARLALLEDHERSNKVIAGLVGCAEGTVWQIRRDLEDIHQIDEYRASPGKPRKDGTPAQDRTELRAALREHVINELDGEITFNREIAKELGSRFGDLSHGSVEAEYRQILAYERGLRDGAAEQPDQVSDPAPVFGVEVAEDPDPKAVVEGSEPETAEDEPETAEGDPEPESTAPVIEAAFSDPLQREADRLLAELDVDDDLARMIGYLVIGAQRRGLRLRLEREA